jgi:Eukaryotic porin
LFNGSVYQKVDSNLDTGIQVSWAAGSQNTTFGIGCKYSLDKDASLRAKVNNSFQIGLGYQQKLRDGNLFCYLIYRFFIYLKYEFIVFLPKIKR